VAALRDPKRDALNVRLGIIGADETQLHEESSSFGPSQNIRLFG
jgi:hypothetical protein